MTDLDVLKRANPHRVGEAPAPPEHLADSIVGGFDVARVVRRSRRWHPAIVAAAAAVTVLIGVGGLLSAGLLGGDDTIVATQPTDERSLVDDTGTSASTSVSSSATAVATTSGQVGVTEPPLVDCSASGAEPLPIDGSLPVAVAEARRTIYDAAVACDFEALGALTTPLFTASFGGGDPETYWRELEQRGSAPLRALIDILALPAVQQTYETSPEGADFERAVLRDRLTELELVWASENDRLAALEDELATAADDAERSEIDSDLRRLRAVLGAISTEISAIERWLDELDAVGTTQVVYTWPAASVYDTWADVPELEREQLRALYGDSAEEAFAEFEAFGSYTGWRTAISEAGSWLFFVAGD